MIVWIVALITLVVVILVIALVARRTPSGSGGAPGEVMADRPLSQRTGASWDDHEHAGSAEDRPAGPDAEAMDPEGAASPAVEPATPDPTPGEERP